MKKKGLWLGIHVIVLVFGMMIVGCDNNSTNDNGGNGNTGNGSGGIFTLNNIPSEYNGKYAGIPSAGKNGTIHLCGAQYNTTIDTFTGVLISNGKVNLPMWLLVNDYYEDRAFELYNGNHTLYVQFGIWNSSQVEENEAIVYISFDSVVFSNGNATKSWNDGEMNEY